MSENASASTQKRRNEQPPIELSGVHDGTFPQVVARVSPDVYKRLRDTPEGAVVIEHGNALVDLAIERALEAVATGTTDELVIKPVTKVMGIDYA